MNKILLLICLMAFSFVTMGQTDPTQNTQWQGNANNLLVTRGILKADSGFVNARFADTASANINSYLKYYAGSQIFTTSDNALWIRNISATRWLFVGNGTGSSTNTCAGLLSGGVVTWNSLLEFDVSAAIYCINNNTYNSNSGTITLDAADPSLPRIDVIGVDTLGQIFKITGTAAADPAVPQVDPASQLYLTNILVAAGATTPSGVSQVVLWNENTGSPEYTGTNTGAVTNFDNTLNPYVGIKATDVGAWSSTGLKVSVTYSGTAYSTTTYNTLKFFIRLKSTLATTANIYVTLRSGGVAVTSPLLLSSLQGLNKSLTGVYQNISIPFTDFASTSFPSTIDGIRITTTGSNTSGFYLDYMTLNGGVTTGNTNYLTDVFASNDSLYKVKNGITTFWYKVTGGGGGIDSTTLSDSLAGFIPLIGTRVGKPITGDLVFDNGTAPKRIKGNFADSYIEFSDDGTIGINQLTGSNVNVSGVDFSGKNDVSAFGMKGYKNYSANYDNLTYIQKVYSDSITNLKLNISDTTDKWVQSVANNAGGDSLIVVKNGVRTANKYPAGGSTNIYTSDGTLTGTRVLTANTFQLKFKGGLNTFTKQQEALTLETSETNKDLALVFNNTDATNARKWEFTSVADGAFSLYNRTSNIENINFNGTKTTLAGLLIGGPGSYVLGNNGSYGALWFGVDNASKTANNVAVASNGNYSVFNAPTSDIYFTKGNATRGKVFSATGNWLIQTGGTETDVTSALLNVSSTTKGALLPRLTTTQRDAISSPATGLTVYNTTTNTNDTYLGGAWVNDLQSASPSFTGLLSGVGTTQTGSSAVGVVDLSQTWNTTGNVTGIKYNVTNTASGASSNLMDLQVGGVSKFKVGKSGRIDGIVSGITGANLSINILLENKSTSTGTTLTDGNIGVLSAIDDGTTGTSGMNASFGTYAVNRGSGSAIGTMGVAFSSLGTGNRFGVIGRATSASAASGNWVGGYFETITGFSLAAPSLSLKSVLIANSGTGTNSNIFTGLINGVADFVINQSGVVGIGTSTLPASSKLTVESTTQGFLPPRMTTTQRDAIASPATGLTVYNTTTNTNDTYLGGAWVNDLQSASPSFTGLLSGVGTTQTGSSAVGTVSISQTLNTTGNVDVVGIDLINTASGSLTNIFNVKLAGVSKFSIAKSGTVTASSITYGTSGYNNITSDNLTTIITGAPTVAYQAQIRPFSANNSTSGEVGNLKFTGTFSPTSGTATYTGLKMEQVFNQTGGASGITRGLYIAPTLTAAADFRAIETTIGKVIFNGTGNVLVGTTTDVASSKLTVESTTQGFLPPRMTTTQKNAIASPATGLMVFDTTLAKLCVYTGAAWETITSL